jgi:hypothetical protein
LLYPIQDFDQAFVVTNDSRYYPLFTDSVILMEGYFRRGVAFVLLAIRENCRPQYLINARDNFIKLSEFGSIPLDYSREQTWRNMANRAERILANVHCTDINEGDFTWLQELGQ